MQELDQGATPAIHESRMKKDQACDWMEEDSPATSLGPVSKCRHRNIAFLHLHLPIQATVSSLKMWPEFLSKIVHIAMDRRESASVRCNCFRSLLLLLQTCSPDPSQSDGHGDIAGFITALKQNEVFWEMVLRQAKGIDGSPALVSVCIGLTLSATRLEIESVTGRLCRDDEKFPANDLLKKCCCSSLKEFFCGSSNKRSRTCLNQLEMEKVLNETAIASGSAVILEHQAETIAEEMPLHHVLTRLLEGLHVLLAIYRDRLQGVCPMLQCRFFDFMQGLLATTYSFFQKSNTRSNAEILSKPFGAQGDSWSGNSLCALVAHVIPVLKSLKHALYFDLLALTSQLTSTQNLCALFVQSEDNSVRLVRILVHDFLDILSSTSAEEKPVVYLCLKNMIAFTPSVRKEVSETKFHRSVLHKIQQLYTDACMVPPDYKNMTVQRKTSKLAKKMKRKEPRNKSSALKWQQTDWAWLKRCLCLLGHLSHEDRESTQELPQEGICDLFFMNWERIDQSPHRIYASVTQVLACMIYAAPQETQKELTKHRDGKRSLLQCLIQSLVPSQIEKCKPTLECLAVIAVNAKGAAALIKHGILAKCKETLEDSTTWSGTAVLSSRIFKLLENLCGHEYGRDAVMSASQGKTFVKIIHTALNSQESEICSISCLSFVRNLAFSRTFLHQVLGHPTLLERIHQKASVTPDIELSQGTTQIAMQAVLILSILTSRGEKVKVAIRGIKEWASPFRSLIDRLTTRLKGNNTHSAVQDEVAGALVQSIHTFMFLME